MKCLYLNLNFSFTLSEMLGSEREYVDRLSYCIRNYKKAIESGKSLRGESKELFGNIEEIHKFHRE